MTDERLKELRDRACLLQNGQLVLECLDVIERLRADAKRMDEGCPKMTEDRLSEIEQLLAGWECWLPGNPDFELDHDGAVAACGAVRDLLAECDRLKANYTAQIRAIEDDHYTRWEQARKVTCAETARLKAEIKAAVEAEREVCAQLAFSENPFKYGSTAIAEAIRARSHAGEEAER